MLKWQLVVMFLSFGLAVVAVAMAFVMNRRSMREITASEQRLSDRIKVLESELSAVMEGAFGVANHLQKLEMNLKNTVQRQEQLQQRDMGNMPYNDAVRLASKGAGVDELVEHCGLSRSEAELVAMLHKKSPPVMSNKYDPERGDTNMEPPVIPSNVTEQAIEELMSEQFSQLQADPLRSAADAVAEECSTIEPEKIVPDDEDDELPYFSDALARFQERQRRQEGEVESTDPSKSRENQPVGRKHNSDE